MDSLAVIAKLFRCFFLIDDLIQALITFSFEKLFFPYATVTGMVKLILRAITNRERGRHVAKNSDRGENNNEVSTFKYILLLVFKASSTKDAFFWCFYSE